jgi:hypothetical protein
MSCSALALVVGGTPVAGAASPAAADGTFLPAPGHTEVRAGRNLAEESTNWAGYVQSAGKHTFTAVSDTFVVPTVDAGAADGVQYAADWVGIGGFARRDRTLVQTGIQTVVTTTKNHGTTVAYNAWTETLPQAENPLTLTLNAGDVVTATVQETTKNKWVMTVDDVTTGQSQGRSVTYHSKGMSAEAIHERPCLQAPCNAIDLATLAQTSNVTFDPGTFSVTPGGGADDLPLLESGVTGLTLNEVEMTDNTGETVIAIPSGPDATSDGFAVADGSTPPPPPTI